MSNVVAIEHLTLDGVMQAPGRPDEDPRDGFAHGGWAQPGNDEVMARRMGEGMAQGGPLLLGRVTYEAMYDFWPKQTANPYTPVLDRARKYVASTTLAEPLPWQNSTLLCGDVPAAVARLREQPGPDVVALGSGVLVRSLLAHGLVDELLLMIHPLVLGAGRRLFDDGVPPRSLRLGDSETTTTGVIMATYRPAAGG
jgi:dihydrofolate reductase